MDKGWNVTSDMLIQTFSTRDSGQMRIFLRLENVVPESIPRGGDLTVKATTKPAALV